MNVGMLWIKLIMTSQIAIASGLNCPLSPFASFTHLATQVSSSVCLDQCHEYFKKNPDAKVADDGICLNSSQRLKQGLELLSPESKTETLLTCASGLWDGLLTIDDQVRAYLKNASDVVKKAKEQKIFLEKCAADIKCKISLARNSIQFSKRGSTGAYEITDASLIEHIKGRTVEDLLTVANIFKKEKQSYCGRLLIQTNNRIADQISISSTVPQDQRLAEVQKQTYRFMEEKSKECITWLNLKKPEAPKLDAENFFSKLGINLQCMDPQRATKLMCMFLGTTLADPINLVGGSAGLAAKLVKVARIARTEKEAAEALRSLANIEKLDAPVAPKNIFNLSSICSARTPSCRALLEEDLAPLSNIQREEFLKTVDQLNASPEQKQFLVHYYSSRVKKMSGMLNADISTFKRYLQQSFDRGLKALQDHPVSSNILANITQQMDRNVIGSIVDSKMYSALQEVVSTAESTWERFGTKFVRGEYNPTTNHLSGGHTFEALKSKDGILQSLSPKERLDLTVKLAKPNSSGRFSIKVNGQVEPIEWQTDKQGLLVLKFTSKKSDGTVATEIKTLLPETMKPEEVELLYKVGVARFKFGRSTESKVIDVRQGRFCIRMVFDGAVVRDGTPSQHGHPIGSCI